MGRPPPTISKYERRITDIIIFSIVFCAPPTPPPGFLPGRGGGFEPYADNGGTVVAVAGRDYCIIAADSRLSDGYAILTRNVTRVHRLSGDTHLATAGCWADTQGLLRLLQVSDKGFGGRGGGRGLGSTVPYRC